MLARSLLRRTIERRRFPALAVAGLLVAGSSAACYAVLARSEKDTPAPPAVESLPARAPVPAEPTYRDLSRKHLAGGQITFVLPGSPEEVRAMILDFDHAAGHRPWAKEYELLEESAQRTLARWSFQGRLGVHPRVEIELLTRPAGEGTRIDFRIVQAAFGIRTFSGTYELQPIAGNPEGTLVAESVFIDSGLRFTNASPDDVEQGLRADARGMAAWMRERLGG